MTDHKPCVPIPCIPADIGCHNCAELIDDGVNPLFWFSGDGWLDTFDPCLECNPHGLEDGEEIEYPEDVLDLPR